jgi:hypothetical protein
VPAAQRCLHATCGVLGSQLPLLGATGYVRSQVPASAVNQPHCTLIAHMHPSWLVDGWLKSFAVTESGRQDSNLRPSAPKAIPLTASRWVIFSTEASSGLLFGIDCGRRMPVNACQLHTNCTQWLQPAT